jgi:hypothetical protein
VKALNGMYITLLRIASSIGVWEAMVDRGRRVRAKRERRSMDTVQRLMQQAYLEGRGSITAIGQQDRLSAARRRYLCAVSCIGSKYKMPCRSLRPGQAPLSNASVLFHPPSPAPFAAESTKRPKVQRNEQRATEPPRSASLRGVPSRSLGFEDSGYPPPPSCLCPVPSRLIPLPCALFFRALIPLSFPSSSFLDCYVQCEKGIFIASPVSSSPNPRPPNPPIGLAVELARQNDNEDGLNIAPVASF